MSGRSMTAREGRENQRYTPEGTRIVAGAVVVDPATSLVLVISSESHPKRWVLPKGGAELDETIEESALRETWEESGAIGRIVSDLGTFIDPKPPKHWKGDVASAPPSTQFRFFEVELEKLEDAWPEQHKRRRQWVTCEKAQELMLENNRKQLAEALALCSLAKAPSATRN